MNRIFALDADQRLKLLSTRVIKIDLYSISIAQQLKGAALE